MKREWLTGILTAITDEDEKKSVVDQIMRENGTDINKAKGEKTTLADKVDELTAENEKLKTENESLKAQDFEGIKAENAKLKNDLADEKKAHKAEIDSINLKNSVLSEIRKEHSRNDDVVLKLIDLSKVTINDKGELEGLEDQVKALKEDETTKSLFEDSNPNGATPKGGNPAGTDPSKMSYTELTNYLNNGGTLQ